VTGAPPPLPRSWPSLIDAAYPRSTRIAVAQSTVPLATMMVTGTLTPVRVAPQLVPALPAAAPDEHPATASRASSAIASIAIAKLGIPGIAGLVTPVFNVTPPGPRLIRQP
jgi:hypothetical protein